MKKNKLVCGVGVNDLGRPVYWKENGKYVICPIYRVWKSMLVRCYDKNFHHKVTYAESYVVPEWLRLSNFEKWMEQQDWKGKELDKDILFQGNKIYGPETCVFIPHDLNVFLIDSAGARGEYPIGVSFHKNSGQLQVDCGNPFTRKREYLGLFKDVQEAHLTWKAKKHQHALTYAEQQTDPRIAEALRTRYL
jgi:hypothetical protein